MATLMLTAVGTALGGPIGGAIGALAGQKLDSSLLGSGGREGPRLQDLKVSTSSYGQPIPWLFGANRVAGTVIWSTDLKEHRQKSGGGKGKPKVTTYSYSVSFAVALASRPIDQVGRIWADGSLLRGAAGDLKVGGTSHVYLGWGDQPLDPLIAAAEGADATAFRNLAYVVFEDLDLSDFGNRIPALSFEVFSGDGSDAIVEMSSALDAVPSPDLRIPEMQGLAWEGAELGQMLSLINGIHPIHADCASDRLSLSGPLEGMEPSALSQPAVSRDQADFGEATGHSRHRTTDLNKGPNVLRYYDSGRDYQPGSQRASGRAPSGREEVFEFPGTLSAPSARKLIGDAMIRRKKGRERLHWRAAEIDTQLTPGALVSAPGFSGAWRVESWEWRETGIELELSRIGSTLVSNLVGDEGRAWRAPDQAFSPTLLRAFELPIEDAASQDTATVYAAASSAGGGWPGAGFYAEIGTSLVPLEEGARRRAVTGVLSAPLTSSPAVRFEPSAQIVIEMDSEDFELQSENVEALAFGANRICIGGEVLQFANAERISAKAWSVTGLLRGRGGTEAAAFEGHSAGTGVTLISDDLVAISRGDLVGADRLAAIGPADNVPVYAELENVGLAQRPLTPVHPRRSIQNDGSLELSWTRRARGAWIWSDEVDVPVTEDRESYLVGLGPVDQPYAVWNVTTPVIAFGTATVSELSSNYPAARFWVRQAGTYAQSQPLDLGPVG